MYTTTNVPFTQIASWNSSHSSYSVNNSSLVRISHRIKLEAEAEAEAERQWIDRYIC